MAATALFCGSSSQSGRNAHDLIVTVGEKDNLQTFQASNDLDMKCEVEFRVSILV